MEMSEETEAALAACGDADTFARVAALHGIALTPEQRAQAARPDPIGAVFFLPFAANAKTWPSPGWLPVHLTLVPEPAVDWGYVGAPAPLLDRFALRRAMDRPINRVFRKRMRLDDFIDGAEAGRAPAGLLFHTGRCGSTLAARMCALVPEVLVLSELPVVSQALALAASAPHLAGERGSALLRAILSAYGGRLAARRLIVRFEAHNALVLALASRAFAQTPVAFLFRDPVEVLVSYQGDGGIAAALSGAYAALWDPAELAARSSEDFPLLVLARICERALAHLSAHGGLAVNYRDLPVAVADKILPHFGMTADERVREAMQHVARMNAKIDTVAFIDDSADKQRAAGDALRARADTELGAAYRALEDLAARPHA
jgi:hypothetical protein